MKRHVTAETFLRPSLNYPEFARKRALWRRALGTFAVAAAAVLLVGIVGLLIGGLAAGVGL